MAVVAGVGGVMRSLGDTCREVMLAIALKQDEPARTEMLAIMRDDGWLSEAEIAALGLGRAA